MGQLKITSIFPLLLTLDLLEYINGPVKLF